MTRYSSRRTKYTRRRRKSSAATALLWLVLLLAGLAVLGFLLNTVGPLEGWVQRLNQSASAQGPAQSRKESAHRFQGYPMPPAATAANLRPILGEVVKWLEMQQRRVGGKIAASVAARHQSGRALLYLSASPAFLEQDRELRLQLAEGIWGYWAERAVATNLVSRKSAAHLVILNGEGAIVGGSRPDAAAKLWMQDG